MAHLQSQVSHRDTISNGQETIALEQKQRWKLKPA